MVVIATMLFICHSAYSQSDSTNVFDLNLEQLIQIEVVSANKISQTISEAPALITVISAEQIKQRGYTNLAMILNSLPGIYILDDYLQFNAGIRGINSGMESWSRVFKLMIDNQPVAFRSTAENWLGTELIPISAIERVEVVRGPVSTIYGANAFLGVVNIITKKGDDQNGLIVNLGTTVIENKLGFNSEFSLAKKIGKIDFLVSYAKNRINKAGINIINMQGNKIYTNKLSSENDIDNSQSIFSKISVDLNKYGIVSFSFSRQSLDNNAQFQNWSVLSDSNRIVINNTFAKLKYSNTNSKKNIVGNISMVYSFGAPDRKQKMFVKNNLNPQGYYLKRDVGFESFDLVGDLSYIFKSGSAVTIGYDHTVDFHNLQTYYEKDIHGNFILPLQSKMYGDTTFVNTGIYALATIYPFKKVNVEMINGVSLIGGIRFDKQNLYGNNISYRLGIVMPVKSNLYFKILYGNSYKEPASVQLYTNAIYTNGIIGNDNLKPEKAETYEFITGLIFNDKFSLTLSPFISKIKDKVEIIPYFSNYRATNISSIESYGAEVDVQFFIYKISGYVNFSYQKSTLAEPSPINPAKLIEKEVSLFPKIMVKNGINIPIRSIKTNFNIEGRYIDQIIASPQNLQVYDPVFLTKKYKLPSYYIMDMTISSINIYLIKFRETILQFRILNLFNTKYVMPGFKDYDINGYGRNFQFRIIQNF